MSPPIQTGSFVINVRFSSDNQKLVTASYDGAARVWSLKGQRLAEYQSGSVLVDANLSPDGRQLVAVGVGKVGWSWQMKTLDQLLRDGCHWMQDYLTTHPDEAEEFTVCGG